MPDDGLDQLRRHDAIFLGAVGAPGVPDDVSLWGLLIPIRRAFRQYINLRPVRVFPGIESPLRSASREIDLVVVRENTEGEYSEIGGRFHRGFPDETAVQQSVFTRAGVTRIVDYAFRLAGERRGELTSATKSNGIVHTMPFWDEIVTEWAASFPGVTWSQEHIDALCAKLVLAPSAPSGPPPSCSTTSATPRPQRRSSMPSPPCWPQPTSAPATSADRRPRRLRDHHRVLRRRHPLVRTRAY